MTDRTGPPDSGMRSAASRNRNRRSPGSGLVGTDGFLWPELGSHVQGGARADHQTMAMDQRVTIDKDRFARQVRNLLKCRSADPPSWGRITARLVQDDGLAGRPVGYIPILPVLRRVPYVNGTNIETNGA